MSSNSHFKHRFLTGKSLKRALLSYFTEYETPKLVLIHSITFGVLLRSIQIIILIYSVLYLLIYEKGYQKQDTAIISSVTIKVKGIGHIHTSEDRTIVVDAADYVIPPSENNAAFIMTNFYQTDQTRSTCLESKRIRQAICKNDSDCLNTPSAPNVNGRWTGRCLLSPEVDIIGGTTDGARNSTGLCEYEGWCPPEDDLLSPMLVQGSLNFTLFLKNFIEFPTFSIKHKNMVDDLKPCIFHPEYDKDCPIFTIDYIINQAEKDGVERSLMLRYGAIINIKLDWNCNLDRSIELCKPEYSFTRLDAPFREKPFSVGFNFRYASLWKHNKKSIRTLTKAYGLRLIVTISGKASKFDFITLSLNTGSLVGIFGLATFVCDIILLHLSKKSHIYRNYVFEIVHLRTRFDSIIENLNDLSKNNIHKYSNSVTNKRATSSDETFSNDTITSAKVVIMHPLTPINPN